jgi:hypothetical protein
MGTSVSPCSPELDALGIAKIITGIDVTDAGAAGAYTPFPLNLSSLCPFPLNLSLLCPPCDPN